MSESMKMKINSKMKSKYLGKVFDSSNCGKFEIVEYFNYYKVKVRFLATGYEVFTSSKSIKNGTVKDKMHPTHFGVGFIGDGKYKACVGGNNTKAYTCWNNMLSRCYTGNHKSYIGVTVCEDWHNFQNFAKWYDENYIEGFHLDKDIIKKHLKIYSPSTCQFVESRDNLMFEFSLRRAKIISSEVSSETGFCEEKIIAAILKSKKAMKELGFDFN